MLRSTIQINEIKVQHAIIKASEGNMGKRFFIWQWRKNEQRFHYETRYEHHKSYSNTHSVYEALKGKVHPKIKVVSNLFIDFVSFVEHIRCLCCFYYHVPFKSSINVVRVTCVKSKYSEEQSQI